MLTGVCRYRVLATGVPKDMPIKDKCAVVLKKFDAASKNWQLGATKVCLHFLQVD